jgi:ribonuclease Z
MCFELTVLGSAAALPDSRQISTAQILKYKNKYFLFDCAEGTQIRLRQNKISFAAVDHIFISHLHGDHYYGIFGLIKSFELLGRKRALNIYAHKELEQQLDIVSEYKTAKFPIFFHALNPKGEDIILDKKSFYIKSFPLFHRIETCGFVFREKPKELNIRKESIQKYQLGVADILKIKKGNDFIDTGGNCIPNRLLTYPPYKTRSFAFCTDTAYHDPIAESIRNVDLLYHEATFSETDKELAAKTQHSTSVDAARTAKNAGAGKLLVGHISNRYPDAQIIVDEAKTIFENTFEAKDNSQHIVKLTREEKHTKL